MVRHVALQASWCGVFRCYLVLTTLFFFFFSFSFSVCSFRQSTGLSYRDPEALKPYFADQLPTILKCWAKLLGDNDFFTGSEVTVADLKV